MEIEFADKEEFTVKGDIQPCANQYEGIGLAFNVMHKVVKIAKGWPADRAGIRIGDYLVDPYNMLPKDGIMEFEVIRNDKKVRMRLRTESICQKESKP